MNNEYDRLKQSGEFDREYGSLRAAHEMIELVKGNGSDSVARDQYERLAEKFEKAMQLIEVMRTKIGEIESSQLPTKDEVESISSMLDLLARLDDTSISRIKKLGEMNSGK